MALWPASFRQAGCGFRRYGGHCGMLTLRTTCRAAASVVLIAVCSACVPASSSGSPSGARGAGSNRGVISVGSFDFPESGLLAEIYGQALAAHGFPVRIVTNLGSRELVDPALMSGLIQLVPEYAGSALEFASLGRQSAASSADGDQPGPGRFGGPRRAGGGAPGPGAGHKCDCGHCVHRGPVSPAVDRRPREGGAPPGVRRATRMPWAPYCLPGLERTYGVHFRAFIPLDAAGPLTLQALDAGNVSAALLFSTNPSIHGAASRCPG